MLRFNSASEDQIVYGTCNAQEPYLLAVPYERARLPNLNARHKIALTIASYSGRLNEELADSFQNETGIILPEVCDDQSDPHLEYLNSMLIEFERDPERFIAMLTRE